MYFCVKMCTELLPPGVNPIAVNKYIISDIISYHTISYHIISYHIISYRIISYHIRIRTVIRLGVLCSYAAGNSQEPTDSLHFIFC
jgi:hypothetical protein